ncbi:Hypothetical protein NTJ_04436 [Nesidiocoris tenuis]|uniref:Uncharacterized protein n=1 Tax=Nesidiocoris tenuis TaxID=355587 RepID=A0ABN7AI53_9HEMI|nr:Hypothetical protein NTJ_04436 [Nesidiocoris tenuis]
MHFTDCELPRCKCNELMSSEAEIRDKSTIREQFDNEPASDKSTESFLTSRRWKEGEEKLESDEISSRGA